MDKLCPEYGTSGRSKSRETGRRRKLFRAGKGETMEHYKFFQNRDCEYFPCHAGADPETFSCLFCYCPLYALGIHRFAG